ncbi:hypothetical protein BS47DRAFT_1352550 [Hydnum rufescens UP504]|uniref:DUF6534 domain-containing protein n=1 Tax=Hydnum rufescens UP504 TaxID=1448309 RepID=A0A9P6DL61_9AGAM|nr:hypothetical protein BS47DRAFT_1352550 [Hydnum rufescens UP504]
MEIMKGALLNVFGGTFFGNLLTAVCFGVLTIQISSYYHAFPNDGRPLKMVVGFLWALEGFQLACVTQSLYWWFVKNYHNPLALARATWEFAIYQISTVCASVTVQTFFAHRVYSLSANLYLGILVEVLVLLQFGFGAATAIRANILLSFELVVKECTWLVVTWLATQAVADIVIATCMCLLLRRRRTGFQKTDSIINRMALYTISTGLVTSILSCIVLVMFARDGFHFSVLTIGVPLGGFYSITMLANLHTRKSLLTRLATPTPLEIVSFSMKKRMRLNAAGSVGSNHRSTMVNVTRETVRDDMDVRPTKPSYLHPSSLFGER